MACIFSDHLWIFSTGKGAKFSFVLWVKAHEHECPEIVEKQLVQGEQIMLCHQMPGCNNYTDAHTKK